MFTYKIEDTFRHVNFATCNTIQITDDIVSSYGEVTVKVNGNERKICSVIETGTSLSFSWNILNKIFDHYVPKEIVIIVNKKELKAISEVDSISEVLIQPIWNSFFPDFDFSNSIREYFLNNIYLCSNDCIKVPVNFHDSTSLLSLSNLHSLFINNFFVNISSISSTKLDERHLYLFDHKTSKMVFESAKPIQRKVFDIDSENHYYSEDLHNLAEILINSLRTFKYGSFSSMLGRPLVHVCCPSLSGKGTLISQMAKILGHQLIVIRFTELAGLSSSAMEKKFDKISSLIENGNFLSIHFEDFDRFFENNDSTIKDKYDNRTIRVFTKMLQSLSIVDDKEIILFLSTVNAVSSEVDRFVFVRYNAGELSDSDRTAIVRQSFTNDGIVEDLVKLAMRIPRLELMSIMRVISSSGLNSQKDIADKFKSVCVRSIDREAAVIESVSWRDIGGLAEVIEEVLVTIKLTLSQHKPVKGYMIRKSGILLFGDPGTGKTLLAKAVASECNLNFVSVKGPELLNMYVGQTEENVRALFTKVKRMVPCLLFCDELDSLVPRRGFSGDSGGVMDRVVSQFATEMDSINDEENMRVIVMGATNRPDLIDPALLRNGRFDKMFHIKGSLDKKDQLEILRSQTYKLNLDDGVDLNYIADRFPKGAMTGAVIFGIVSNAVMNAIRRTIGLMEIKAVDEDVDLTLKTNDFIIAIDSLK